MATGRANPAKTSFELGFALDKGKARKLPFSQNALNYLCNLSNVLKKFHEVKTYESSQQICQNSKFNILDYLTCQCKIPFKNI